MSDNPQEKLKAMMERAREEQEARDARWEALFPMTLNSIEFNDNPPYKQGWRGNDVGRFVSVRPCNMELNPEQKTYLGLYLGEVPISTGVSYNKEKAVLTVGRDSYNPAIFVFDLKTVVLGAASWWGVIRSEEQLGAISDADINDVWYVKALKALADVGGDEEE